MARFKNDRCYTVYCHTNIKTKKRYIGITKNRVEDRWQNGFGYKENTIFFQDIVKYGWDNFLHYIVEENLTYKEAVTAEQQLISKGKTNNPNYGYNVSPGVGLANKVIKIFKHDAKTLQIIKVYDGYEDLPDIYSKSAVCGCCNKFTPTGKPKTYKGFIWSKQYYGEVL